MPFRSKFYILDLIFQNRIYLEYTRLLIFVAMSLFPYLHNFLNSSFPQDFSLLDTTTGLAQYCEFQKSVSPSGASSAMISFSSLVSAAFSSVDMIVQS